MRNWSVDIKELKKDKEQYAIWRLEQMVNFGLGGERLNIIDLKKYWNKLHLDPNKKKFLLYLMDKKQPYGKNNPK